MKYHYHEFKLGPVNFTYDAGWGSADRVVDISLLGGSYHNEGTHLLRYLWAPYVFITVGDRCFGIDAELFPRKEPLVDYDV